MSKLEEIARAIYADRNGSGCKPWGNLPHSHKAPYLRDALAAVKAMREPTQGAVVDGLVAMVTSIQAQVGELEPVEDGQILTDEQAANRYMSIGALMRNGKEVRATYEAMIDSIIAEAEQEGE